MSLPYSEPFPGAFELSSTGIWEASQQQEYFPGFPHGGTREWSAVKRVLMLTLEMAVGAVAYAGTMLAISAWTGASL
jgi:hypothetical protein